MIFVAFFVFVENMIFNEGFLLHRKRNIKIQKVCLILFIIIGTLLCAFRSINNTPDTRVYAMWYDGWTVSSFSDFFNVDNNVEVGFELLSRFLKLFFKDDYVLYFGTIGLIILSMSSIAIWNLTNRRITVFLLFYSIFGFYYSYIVIRQGLAIAIILFTLSKVYKKRRLNWLKFLFGIIIASLFHRTALICLLALPIIYKRNHLGYFEFFVLLLSVLFSANKNTIYWVVDSINKVGDLLPNGAAKTKILEYFSDISLTNSSNILVLGIFVFALLFVRKKTFRSYPYRSLISFHSIGVLILSLFSGVSIGIRFADYFLIAECFTIPEARHGIGKGICLVILLIIACIYSYFRLSIFI